MEQRAAPFLLEALLAIPRVRGTMPQALDLRSRRLAVSTDLKSSCGRFSRRKLSHFLFLDEIALIEAERTDLIRPEDPASR